MKRYKNGDGPVGEPPGQGGGETTSARDVWADHIVDRSDPGAPWTTHENIAEASRRDNDHSSHAMPEAPGESEYGTAGMMPKNRYRGREASENL
jgi:hypothetical protein